MPRIEWNDQMRVELLRLKAELRSESLKSLAPGLGFGRFSIRPLVVDTQDQPTNMGVTEAEQENLRPILEQSVRQHRPPNRPLWQPLHQSHQPVSAAREKKRDQKTKTKEKESARLLWLPFVLMCLLDAAFVFSTSVFALVGLQLVSGEKIWWNLSTFMKFDSVGGLGGQFFGIPLFFPFFALVGLSYLILFKLLLGSTLGQIVVRSQSLSSRAI